MGRDFRQANAGSVGVEGREERVSVSSSVALLVRDATDLARPGRRVSHAIVELC